MRRMIYIASVALGMTAVFGVAAPAAQAHCTVNVGSCSGHCYINAGTCASGGSCTVTVGYCDDSALLGL